MIERKYTHAGYIGAIVAARPARALPERMDGSGGGHHRGNALCAYEMIDVQHVGLNLLRSLNPIVFWMVIRYHSNVVFLWVDELQ